MKICQQYQIRTATDPQPTLLQLFHELGWCQMSQNVQKEPSKTYLVFLKMGPQKFT